MEIKLNVDDEFDIVLLLNSLNAMQERALLLPTKILNEPLLQKIGADWFKETSNEYTRLASMKAQLLEILMKKNEANRP